MKPAVLISEIALLLFLSTSTHVLMAEKPGCMRCHGMKTLAYRDSLTGGLVSLFVDYNAFKQTQHGEFGCTDCHLEAFETFPHSPETREENLSCSDCHDLEEDVFARVHFQTITEEFERSVHRQRLQEQFSCFSCHDPHLFSIDSVMKANDLSIRESNSMCLNCHESSVTHTKIQLEETATIAQSHSWLPALKKHWAALRCTVCHRESSESHTHAIPPAETASGDCAGCHGE
jgi:hypothetical protein